MRFWKTWLWYNSFPFAEVLLYMCLFYNVIPSNYGCPNQISLKFMIEFPLILMLQFPVPNKCC